MSIEKLTDEERGQLEVFREWRHVPAAKALRIIDQLTAALEAAERKADDLQIEAGEARKHYRAAEQNVVWVREQRIAAEARAEALQARVAELECSLGVERATSTRLRELAEELRKQALSEAGHAIRAEDLANAAESELATAKARVAELEAAKDALAELLGQAAAKLTKADSELADLRGRVERAEDELAKSIHPAARRALEALRGR